MYVLELIEQPISFSFFARPNLTVFSIPLNLYCITKLTNTRKKNNTIYALSEPVAYTRV